jgi:hypothetical protein
VTALASAALRACAAGLYAEEAGTELVITHGGFLHRPDFMRYVDTFTSIHDATLMAQIDWQSLHSARPGGQLPLSGGERRILNIAASLAAGTQISLRDTLPGLDNRNLDLVTTAIRHAAGHRPPRP